MKLVLVMPTFNEAECLEPVVLEWLDLLAAWEERGGPGHQAILLVVNDGSTDRTQSILSGLSGKPRLRVISQRNSGHGPAIRRGYEAALKEGADFVFQTDSDNQTLSPEFWDLWEARDRSSFVIGNRRRADSAHRRLVTKAAQAWIRFLFGHSIPDGNSPFRLMEGNQLRLLLRELPTNVFAPNLCLSLLAKEAGHDPLHLPVTQKKRLTGSSKLRPLRLAAACSRSALDLLRLRLARRAQVKWENAL